MKTKLLLLLTFMLTSQQYAKAWNTPYRADDTYQTRDSNSQVIGGVFEKAGDALVNITGTATSTSIIKTIIGETSLTNGDSIIVRLVANGDCLFDIGPTPDVAAGNGSLLPNDVVELYRVKTDDKIKLLRRTTNGQLSITRLK